MIARISLVAFLYLYGVGTAVYAAVPKPVEEETLLGLLQQHQYEKLEQLLSAAQRDYEADELHSQGLSQGFAAFGHPDATLRSALDDWVERMPRSAYARLARSMYFRSLGWKMRGTLYWRKIPPTSHAQMNWLFLQAVRDAHAALVISPKLMPGYLVLIDIATVYGERKTLHGLFQDAMRIDPLYYDVRAAYLTALEPKWGGSQVAMTAYLADIRPFYKRSPALRQLEVRVWQARGITRFNAKHYREAIDELTKAVDIEPNAYDAREFRGLAYQMLERYDQARADYEYSADRDSERAKYRLGWLYLYGLGVPRDYSLAARWLGEAADADIAPAKSAYAALLWVGDGVSQDKVRAKTLWLEAAAQGDVYAKKCLARVNSKEQG